MLLPNGPGSRVEIACAGVVAESLPGMEDVVFRRDGEGGEIREAPEPLIIIRDHRRDLGLLEHELGNKDGVRIGGAAPGKIAAVFAVPGTKGAPEFSGVAETGRVDKTNVQRPTF